MSIWPLQMVVSLTHHEDSLLVLQYLLNLNVYSIITQRKPTILTQINISGTKVKVILMTKIQRLDLQRLYVMYSKAILIIKMCIDLALSISEVVRKTICAKYSRLIIGG